MLRIAGLLTVVVLALSAAPAGAATIGGSTWKDDGDGVREVGEAPAADVQIAVQRRTRSGAFRRVAAKTTNSRGRWSVRIRARGRYRAVVTLPAWSSGFAPAGRDSDVTQRGRSKVKRLARRGRSARVDAGLLVKAPTPLPPPPKPPVTVGDRVWNDLDDDGLQDAGEPGAAGVTVELWNSARTAKLAATTTNAAGAWKLTPRGATSYAVRLVLPAGAIYTADNVGDDARDSDVHAIGNTAGFADPLSAGTASLDAGIVFRAPVTLGDIVWRDNNHNGIREGGEGAFAPGVSIEVWNASRTQMLASTTTDAGGSYALSVPRDGSYRLHFSAPTIVSFTRPNAGADDALDSDVLAWGDDFGWTAVITPNVSDPTIDAGGLANAISLGNFVWQDTNANGVQDPGEPGVAGVTVQLWDAGRTALIHTATTNANGSYTVRAPHAGDYRMRFVLPPGRAFTLMNASGDTADSDANPSGPNAGYTDAFSVAFNVLSITTFDAGLVPG